MTRKLTLPVLVMVILTGRILAQVPATDSKKVLPKDPLVKDVSLVQLLSMPDVYQGQLVKVVGYLVHQYEHSALYAQQEDHHTLKKNGLWASFSSKVAGGESVDAYLRPYRGKYVAVVGTFDKSKGHLGMFGGTIRAITSIDSMEHSK